MKTIFLLSVLFLLSCQKDTLSTNDLEGDWLIGSSKQMNIESSDTTYSNYEYVGDGTCCDPTFVNVIGDSFITGDVITIGGVEYTIIDHLEDGDGLDDQYQYWVEVEAVQSFDDSFVRYQLFKLSE